MSWKPISLPLHYNKHTHITYTVNSYMVNHCENHKSRLKKDQRKVCTQILGHSNHSASNFNDEDKSRVKNFKTFLCSVFTPFGYTINLTMWMHITRCVCYCTNNRVLSNSVVACWHKLKSFLCSDSTIISTYCIAFWMFEYKN